MEHPKTLYEEASHDLNQFRERRMADRRFRQRDTPDRRVNDWNSLRARAVRIEEAEEEQKVV